MKNLHTSTKATQAKSKSYYEAYILDDSSHVSCEVYADTKEQAEQTANTIVRSVTLIEEIEKLFLPNELTPLDTYNKIAFLLKQK